MELLRDEYSLVRVDERTRVVFVARTEAGFADVTACDRAYAAVVDCLRGIDRRRHGILVDLRRAPSRNDPDFERAIAPHRKRMFQGFACCAVLVRSAAGRLNVSRHAKQDEIVAEIFHEEGKAIAHLAAALAKR